MLVAVMCTVLVWCLWVYKVFGIMPNNRFVAGKVIVKCCTTSQL